MKHVLRLLVILVAVMMLTVLSVSVAMAHDDNGSQGTDRAPVDPNISLTTNPGNNGNGIAQQPAHNPTCVLHDN